MPKTQEQVLADSMSSDEVKKFVEGQRREIAILRDKEAQLDKVYNLIEQKRTPDGLAATAELRDEIKEAVAEGDRIKFAARQRKEIGQRRNSALVDDARDIDNEVNALLAQQRYVDRLRAIDTIKVKLTFWQRCRRAYNAFWNKS